MVPGLGPHTQEKSYYEKLRGTKIAIYENLAHRQPDLT